MVFLDCCVLTLALKEVLGDHPQFDAIYDRLMKWFRAFGRATVNSKPPEKPLAKWGKKELEEWLRYINMPEVMGKLQENDMLPEDIAGLEPADYRDLGNPPPDVKTLERTKTSSVMPLPSSLLNRTTRQPRQSEPIPP
jgi:hypothetical protein